MSCALISFLFSLIPLPILSNSSHNYNPIPQGYQIREHGYLYIKPETLIIIILSMIIFLLTLCICLRQHIYTTHNTSTPQKYNTTKTTSKQEICTPQTNMEIMEPSPSIDNTNIYNINEGKTIPQETYLKCKTINTRLYSISSPVTTPKSNQNNCQILNSPIIPISPISKINNICIKLPPKQINNIINQTKEMGSFKLKKRSSSSAVMRINKTFGQKDDTSSDEDDSIGSPPLPPQTNQCSSDDDDEDDNRESGNSTISEIRDNKSMKLSQSIINVKRRESDRSGIISQYTGILTMDDDDDDENSEQLPFNNDNKCIKINKNNNNNNNNNNNDNDINVSHNDIQYLIENENIKGLSKQLKNWKE